MLGPVVNLPLETDVNLHRKRAGAFFPGYLLCCYFLRIGNAEGVFTLGRNMSRFADALVLSFAKDLYARATAQNALVSEKS